MVAGQPHVQLDPWCPPSGRVQDGRVCHRRRQWTLRVPIHDRYNDVSAHKRDKDILAMVDTSTVCIFTAFATSGHFLPKTRISLLMANIRTIEYLPMTWTRIICPVKRTWIFLLMTNTRTFMLMTDKEILMPMTGTRKSLHIHDK
jgi:hypothetical protein